jgi:hypothetical protein
LYRFDALQAVYTCSGTAKIAAGKSLAAGAAMASYQQAAAVAAAVKPSRSQCWTAFQTFLHAPVVCLLCMHLHQQQEWLQHL